MPNDDVMCLFDDDRGDTVRAARMGKCDAASGCGLAGYGQIGIADYGRTAGETDQPGHAKDADARYARLYAGAIGAGTIIRQTGDEQNAPPRRSEEHTSDIQSLMRYSYAVFCLKKKKDNF